MPDFKNTNNVGTHTGLFTSLHKVVKMLGGAHCFFFFKTYVCFTFWKCYKLSS